MKLPRPKMHARTTELVDERAEVEDKDSAQQKEVDQEDGNNKGMLLDEQAGGTLGAGAIGADPETETVVLDDTVMQAEQAEEREEADAMMMPAELVDAVALGETFRVLMVRVRNTKERLSMASHK